MTTAIPSLLTTPAPPDKYVVLDGARVRYWDEGNGKPVLLVHGLGSAAEFWLPQVVGLSDRFRTVAVDLPGFGRSERAGWKYTLANASRFLRAFLDELGLDRASIAGNSMGGLLSLKFALDHPERLDRLALLASAGLGRDLTWGLRIAATPILSWYLLRKIRPLHVEWGIRSCLADPWSLPNEFVQACVEIAKQPSALACFAEATRVGISLFGQRSRIIVRDRLHEIAAPTLIVWGRQDQVIPVSHAFVAHERLQSSSLVLLDNCGHLPQLEHPERVNELLAQFFTSDDCADCTSQPANFR